MPPKITSVSPGSPADKAGLSAGYDLISINGHEIRDVLDYRFYSCDGHLTLTLERGQKSRQLKIKKTEGADLGLEFETYLIDKQKSCSNRCVFCFIDQLPPGMRQSLYFKDDDARLSFLMGNYITLTNLNQADARRIVDMRISPLNVSVHTTDPELRSLMLGSPRGGKSLETLYYFAKSGIQLNCQIVVCPGLNDGDNLRKTLRDLLGLYPSVASVAVVPAGITKWRDGLYDLRAVEAKDAEGILSIANHYGDQSLRANRTRVVYCADELYLKAGLALPDYEFYEDFPQLENGVGMWALFREEFLSAAREKRPGDLTSIATGAAIAPHMRKLLDDIGYTCDNTIVYPIPNRLFGSSVDVSGLVCGGDIIRELSGKPLGGRLLIPSTMLRHDGDLFLDDTSPAELQAALGVPVVPVDPDGGKLREALFSIHNS
ncbi:hypothetical protein FACS1894171_2810 [Clostridia bacterium]|nr:hypothetical protein FACS1894171_2810 [Clostridia bacterium]